MTEKLTDLPENQNEEIPEAEENSVSNSREESAADDDNGGWFKGCLSIVLIIVGVVLLYIFNPSKQDHVKKLSDYEFGRYTDDELLLDEADEWVDEQVTYHDCWVFSYTTQSVGRSDNVVSIGVAGFVFTKGNVPESRARKVKKLLEN